MSYFAMCFKRPVHGSKSNGGRFLENEKRPVNEEVLITIPRMDIYLELQSFSYKLNSVTVLNEVIILGLYAIILY